MALPRTPYDPSNYEGLDRLGHMEKYLAQTYQQQTATLTLNRAGSFIASQVFDLGQGVASAVVAATLTARTADGETFGNSVGNIAVPAPAPTASPDNSHFSTDITSYSVFTAGTSNLVALSDAVSIVGLSVRYLLVSAALTLLGTGTYNGANNPTATVALTVTFT